jgi:hypothetical protein
VREQIEDVLPGVPVLSKYQETAVVHGLGRQCGVLTGVVDDILLLDALRFGVGVRCQNIDTRARDVNELSEHTVSPDSSRNREVIQILDPSTTIPTCRFEGLRLTGRPGTLHELEIVELPLSADLVFGRIPVVATGNKTELMVEVDTCGIVIFIVKDLNNGVRTAYNLNGPDTRRPWSDGMVSVPLHRLRRVEGDAKAETGKPAAGTPEIGTRGSRWRIWQRRGRDQQ